MNIKQLSEPFDPKKVHWRVGAMTKDKTKCIALAYIDARDVMDRLDEVCGPENWQSKYEHASNHGYVCSIGIRIGDEWVWKANGAGETQVEAQKGAMSDSFKRAAVLWGIGRYLYDVPNTWVKLDKYNKIEQHELPKLMRTLPNAPKQQAPKAETPFDASSEQDDMAKELGDLIATIEQITTMNNLQGLWATARLKKFWADATDDQRKELDAAKNAKKATLEMAA